MDLLMTIIFTGAIWWLCAYVKSSMQGDMGNIPYAAALIGQGCILYFWFLIIKNGMLF